MRSKTKYEVSDEKIKALFEKAGLGEAENIVPLGAGEFNSVYAVDAGGKEYAIKIAPLYDPKKILTYEQDMLAQEVFYYGQMKDAAGIRVPELYYVDLSCDDLPTGFFIMERMAGTTLGEADLTDAQRKEADRKLAEMVAQMHAVKGDEFGYRQNGQFENWYLAIHAMVSNLVADAKRLGRRSKNGKMLLGYIERNQAILEKVPCSLINFDIWPGNIFCNVVDGEIELAWIDPERCLWGDRIGDFVPMDFMNMTLAKKTDVLKAYNAVTDEPIEVNDENEIRLAVMLGYLGMVMEVEKYARYSWFHHGWWRNVGVCKMLFGACFETLERLS